MSKVKIKQKLRRLSTPFRDCFTGKPFRTLKAAMSAESKTGCGIDCNNERIVLPDLSDDSRKEITIFGGQILIT